MGFIIYRVANAGGEEAAWSCFFCKLCYSTVTRGAQLSSSSNQKRTTSSSSALSCLHYSREQWRHGSAEEEEEEEEWGAGKNREKVQLQH